MISAVEIEIAQSDARQKQTRRAVASTKSRRRERTLSLPAEPSCAQPEQGLSACFLEQVVALFYQPLFKFAYRLCGNPTDAADYTQETFYLAQVKGHQLHTPSKVKSWLFTTLYREFLKKRHRKTRFPEINLDEVELELADHHADKQVSAPVDGRWAHEALLGLEERYRQPLMLFYLENKSYREIAAAIPLPIGTVMSRISRGKRMLAGAMGKKVISNR